MKHPPRQARPRPCPPQEGQGAGGSIAETMSAATSTPGKPARRPGDAARQRQPAGQGNAGARAARQQAGDHNAHRAQPLASEPTYAQRVRWRHQWNKCGKEAAGRRLPCRRLLLTTHACRQQGRQAVHSRVASASARDDKRAATSTAAKTQCTPTNSRKSAQSSARFAGGTRCATTAPHAASSATRLRRQSCGLTPPPRSS